MGIRLRSARTACLGIAAAALAAGCGGGSSGGGGGSSSSSGSPGSGPSPGAAPIRAAPVKPGGQITVLESAGHSGAWYSRDPAAGPDRRRQTAAANQDFMEAVYGQLFMLGPGGKVEPDLATGYRFSPDAKTVTITLRQGVTFSDGTPFNAQAVLWNWNRDLGPAGVRAGIAPPWQVARTDPENPTSPPVKGAIEATGPYTLVIHQDVPDAAFINQLFDSTAMWIASPTAVQKARPQPCRRRARGRSPGTRSAPGRSRW